VKLTEEQCIAIYAALDEFARDVDHYEYGLPYLEFDGRKPKVIELMNQALEADKPGTIREVFLQQELDQTRNALAMVKTQVRNAITDLEDGEHDEAIETLRGLAGDPE
jgi:hypothetical protein